MALPWLPEEEIYPVYLLLKLPTTDLLEAEKNLVKAFRTHFNRTWLSGNNNLSVFYYEQATNNGAESYHETLKSYMKIPHPNIWRFMESLNNIISDYDIEFQRLTNGLATTRGTNYNTRTKLIRRKELRENLINQTCTSLQYLDAMASTIGKENLNPAEPLTVPIDSAISHAVLDSFESEDDLNDDQCHVCLQARSENFALLHDHCVHAGFCESCANHVFETSGRLSNLQEQNKWSFESFPIIIVKSDFFFTLFH